MTSAEWLPIVMQGSFNEIYVVDSNNLRFLHANQAACKNLQYSAEQLANMTLTEIAPSLTLKTITQITLPAFEEEVIPDSFETYLLRQDKSRFPAEIRLFRSDSNTPPALIAISRDISSQRETAEELDQSKSRFSAIVSNTPGLVYQFVREPDGNTRFVYLSEGCHALLGINAERLCAKPTLFLNLILQEDRAYYEESMATSAHDKKGWNWDGRIWIDEWKDIKWINLRATPKQLFNGSVQWDGIMTNITQSKLEEIEIKRSRTRLAELSAHIENVKEQEQTRIAREIHDDLGGNLTAIKMALTLLAKRLPAGNSELTKKAAYVDLLVDRTIECAHRIASDLRPSILDFGIVAAIEWQSEEFQTQTGIPCDFSTNIQEINLHTDQATAIFRIFQEALTNIAKHANATRVTVKLAKTRDNINLQIIDNGKGIAPGERLKPQSFGIRGMIERANSLGGKLTIGTPNEGGCTIAIRIPQSALAHTSRLQNHYLTL